MHQRNLVLNSSDVHRRGGEGHVFGEVGMNVWKGRNHLLLKRYEDRTEIPESI